VTIFYYCFALSLSCSTFLHFFPLGIYLLYVLFYSPTCFILFLFQFSLTQHFPCSYTPPPSFTSYLSIHVTFHCHRPYWSIGTPYPILFRRLPYSTVMKMDAEICCETLITMYHTTNFVWMTKAVMFTYDFISLPLLACRSRSSRGLRHELSSLARTLGSWVRIPLKAWMSVCVYSVFVLSFVQVVAFRRANHSSKESYRLCK
jgi:hypothetical protein